MRTVKAFDPARQRLFPCELWYPAVDEYAGLDMCADSQDHYPVRGRDLPRSQSAMRDAAVLAGTRALIVFSHHSGGHRRAATYLCTHLSSHGYVVAALDHSEVVAPELAPKPRESDEQKRSRVNAWIASRVPDVRFLIDYMLERSPLGCEVRFEPDIGIVGHSFGGWTALAAAETERRIAAVVALAPAGNSNPKPGMLRAPLDFDWGRDVPTLYLVAADDVSLPLAGMYEL